MHCTLKQLNEELKHKKPSEQVFFVPDSAEEIENFCEKMIKKEPEYIVVRLNPNRRQKTKAGYCGELRFWKCFCKKLFQNIFSGIWKMASSWTSCVSCVQDKKCCVYTKMSLFCYP